MKQKKGKKYADRPKTVLYTTPTAPYMAKNNQLLVPGQM